MAAADEIEQSCAKLIVALADYTDNSDYEAALSLFDENAVMDRDGQRFIGIESLRAVYAARPVNRVTCHILSNIAIDVLSTQTAVSRCLVTVYRHHGDSATTLQPPYPLSSPETIGEYRDRFVLTPSGWRFAERITRSMFQAGGSSLKSPEV
ncbi:MULTISPECIES: nuclear transport factor 2 family protein [unclassified Beijerinckia]|uniref:nuclear transport factor 2 family protein n=1 Tax=unclassified Beijerinckia TaxID=2638183 RepID=UPI000898C64B|nr:MULTISPECIES: nuclear transport factor 2 family protein [unclassified Beijerinckia]MDH7798956.1 hypothetical protein [Beijerinckia sp. GAS462]SED85975.1 SnoaL-like domain-containing protein [Beijerinckia sp. 28-YEA-48]